MSEKHKKRKAKKRQARIKKDRLYNRLMDKRAKKLENELLKLKKELEPKIEPIRNKKNDTQS